VGLGYLLFKSVDFPRFLGVLVVIAGGGYLADTFARILVPDFEFTFSLITFVGEALLIVWLFWRAIKGFPSETEPLGGQLTEPRLVEPSTVAP
jgi:membrane protein implicated in regulation of membrane protease activity